MLRAVLDTNVFISGIKSQTTPPGKVLDAWRKKRFVLDMFGNSRMMKPKGNLVSFYEFYVENERW